MILLASALGCLAWCAWYFKLRAEGFDRPEAVVFGAFWVIAIVFVTGLFINTLLLIGTLF